MTGIAPIVANSTVYVDGQFYHNMRFENCQMIYSGGPLPTLLGNQFVNCTWLMQGAASQTLDYLRLLIAIGGRDLVKEALGLEPTALGGA
jgi:hypothetical protein